MPESAELPAGPPTTEQIVADISRQHAAVLIAKEHLAAAVQLARGRGVSWTRIGAALGGITKQSAQRKYTPIIGDAVMPAALAERMAERRTLSAARSAALTSENVATSSQGGDSRSQSWPTDPSESERVRILVALYGNPEAIASKVLLGQPAIGQTGLAMSSKDADLISRYVRSKREAEKRLDRAENASDRHRAAIELDRIREAERPFDLDIVGEFHARTRALEGASWVEHLRIGAELGLSPDDCTRLAATPM